MSVRITRSPLGIVTCLLDNPQRRNALNGAMLETLCRTFEAASRDAHTRAVVLRGGSGTFCAGRDLRELDTEHDDSPVSIAERIAPVTRLARAVRHCAVPTVAVVESKAVGLGVALATWCDLVLAADDATFQIPEARAGIVPTYTAVSLAQAIGQRQALAMCLGGRPIGAAQAQAYGLVQRVCPAAGLDDAIGLMCQELAQGGPQAQRQCKDLLARTKGQGFDAAIDCAATLSATSMRSAEAREGMQAVREKRPPAWTQPAGKDD
ncbi:enoyl-CoA hydratase/isomerase family protein [Bordetella petrii]|uniref:enoyl-CoA hydratase/isomerase family protein n=1 Tax=Bordetella petrii TaxID=94624 RepID=UPI001E4F9272|nr:enoyl-CoA hydratase-related protein [Bordetella petrii]MCD0503800.1 enoyl-CoA hydratase-related protein [Bordetella petrii]